jgi:hypothetical protein
MLWRLATAWDSLDIGAVHRQLRALDILAEESGSACIEFFATERLPWSRRPAAAFPTPAP